MENTNSTLDIYNDEVVTLDTIHHDLGFICVFLIIFTIVLVLRYIYKFFNMFF